MDDYLRGGKLVGKPSERNRGAVIVVDDYRIDKEFRQVLSQIGSEWVEFTTRRISAPQPQIAIAIGPQFISSTSVRALKPDQNHKILAGPRYSIIRREFQAATPRVYKKMWIKFFL